MPVLAARRQWASPRLKLAASLQGSSKLHDLGKLPHLRKLQDPSGSGGRSISNYHLEGQFRHRLDLRLPLHAAIPMG